MSVPDILHPAQLAYDELAASILALARSQGFGGTDPLAAVNHLRTPTGALLRLGRLTEELWTSFFAGFRPDEQQFEQQSFLEQAEALQQSVAALNDGAVPDVALCEKILATLGAYWQQRQHELHNRIDVLIQELRDGQQAQQQAALSHAHASDELQRLLAVLQPVAQEMSVTPAANDEQTPPAQLLLLVLQRVREELRQQQAVISNEHQWRRSWGQGIAAVIQDQEPASAGLREDDVLLLQEIRSVFQGQAQAVAQQRHIRQQYQALQRDAAQKIAQEQAQVEHVRQELLQAQEQLQAYEQAVNDLRAGTQVSPALDHLAVVAPLQRLSDAERQRLWRVLDGVREQAVVILEQLFAEKPVGEDPKILRPRRLRGNAFAFKSVQGQAAALSTAAEMLRPYVKEMSLHNGAPKLQNDLAALRPALQEMVALVGDWRAQIGKAPPLSLSLPAGGAETQLLATLAADIEALLNSRGAAPAAKELRDLSDQVCDLVARAFIRIHSEAGLPERSGKGPAKKRCLEDAAFLAAAGQRAGEIVQAAAQSGDLAGFDIPLKQALQGFLQGAALMHELGAPEAPDAIDMNAASWQDLLELARRLSAYFGSAA
jgi:hypothetical protein